jgi:hypothetical protein
MQQAAAAMVHDHEPCLLLPDVCYMQGMVLLLHAACVHGGSRVDPDFIGS